MMKNTAQSAITNHVIKSPTMNKTLLVECGDGQPDVFIEFSTENIKGFLCYFNRMWNDDGTELLSPIPAKKQVTVYIDDDESPFFVDVKGDSLNTWALAARYWIDHEVLVRLMVNAAVSNRKVENQSADKRKAETVLDHPAAAFIGEYKGQRYVAFGETKRERWAAGAMNAIISNPAFYSSVQNASANRGFIARYARMFAVALAEELDKKE